MAVTARATASSPDLKALRPVASVEPARVPLPSSAGPPRASLTKPPTANDATPNTTARHSSLNTRRVSEQHGLDVDDIVIDHAPRRRYPDLVPLPLRSAKGNASPRPDSRTRIPDDPVRVPLPPSVLSDTATDVAQRHLLSGPFHPGNLARADSPASHRTARGPVAQLIAEDARHGASRRASPSPSRETLRPPPRPEQVTLPSLVGTHAPSRDARPVSVSSRAPQRVPLPPTAATHAAHNVPLPSSTHTHKGPASETVTLRNGSRRTIVHPSDDGTVVPQKVPLPPSTTAATGSRVVKSAGQSAASTKAKRASPPPPLPRAASNKHEETPPLHSHSSTHKLAKERSLPPVPPSSVAADRTAFHSTEAYVAAAQTVLPSQQAHSTHTDKLTEAYVPPIKTPEPSKLTKSTHNRPQAARPPAEAIQPILRHQVYEDNAIIYDVPYIQTDGRLESLGSGLLRSATLPAKPTGMNRFMPRPQHTARAVPERRRDANTFGESVPSPELEAFPAVQLPRHDPRLRFSDPRMGGNAPLPARPGLFQRLSAALKPQQKQEWHGAPYDGFGMQHPMCYPAHSPAQVGQPAGGPHYYQDQPGQHAFQHVQRRPEMYRNPDTGQTQDEWEDLEEWTQQPSPPMAQRPARPLGRPAGPPAMLARPWSRGPDQNQNHPEWRRGVMFPIPPAGVQDKSFDARGTIINGGASSTMDTRPGLPPGLREQMPPQPPRQTRFAGVSQQHRPQPTPVQRPLPGRPMYSPRQEPNPAGGPWEDEVDHGFPPRPPGPPQPWTNFMQQQPHADRPMPSGLQGMPSSNLAVGGAYKGQSAQMGPPYGHQLGPMQADLTGHVPMEAIPQLRSPTRPQGMFTRQTLYQDELHKRRRTQGDYYRRSEKTGRIRTDVRGARSGRRTRDASGGGRIGKRVDRMGMPEVCADRSPALQLLRQADRPRATCWNQSPPLARTIQQHASHVFLPPHLEQSIRPIPKHTAQQSGRLIWTPRPVISERQELPHSPPNTGHAATANDDEGRRRARRRESQEAARPYLASRTGKGFHGVGWLEGVLWESVRDCMMIGEGAGHGPVAGWRGARASSGCASGQAASNGRLYVPIIPESTG